MLEVRLLYKKLENYNKVLEQTVLERTAELRISEARFRRLTELSSDWYWEQDENGHLTKISGPVQEMLGIQLDAALAKASKVPAMIRRKIKGRAGTRSSMKYSRRTSPPGDRSWISSTAAPNPTVRSNI